MTTNFRFEPLQRNQMKMVTGIHLVRHHHWKRVPAMAPELLGQSGR